MRYRLEVESPESDGTYRAFERGFPRWKPLAESRVADEADEGGGVSAVA